MKNYFTLTELLKTDTGLSNTPPAFGIQMYNLEKLTSVLNIIRHWIGSPVHINSAYRSKDVNIAVGGAAKSYHLDGRAADICSDRMDALNWICKELHVRGVLVEYIDHESYIHIAI